MAVFWIVLAVLLGTVEIFTGTFVLIMLAVGALAAAVPALLGAPDWLQGLIFALVSVLTLVGVRPALQNHLRNSAEESPMGLAEIEGSAGLVLERIDLDHGLIKIDGEIWSARPFDTTETFESGERVRVIEIRGATALVWRE